MTLNLVFLSSLPCRRTRRQGWPWTMTASAGSWSSRPRGPTASSSTRSTRRRRWWWWSRWVSLCSTTMTSPPASLPTSAGTPSSTTTSSPRRTARRARSSSSPGTPCPFLPPRCSICLFRVQCADAVGLCCA